MLDSEASRQTAHIFLDAVSIHDRSDTSDLADRDAMTNLALQRLREVGSIILTQDEETGVVTLDMARAGTGIIAVIIACVEGWASCKGVDRDVIISAVRTVIDTSLVD